MNKFLLFSLSLFVCQVSHGANILIFLTFTSKSLKQVFSPIAGELARRGHKVTMVTPYPEKKLQAGVKEIIQHDVRKLMDDLAGDFLPGQEPEPIYGLKHVGEFREAVKMICEMTLSHPDIQDILNGKLKFDLAIVNLLLEDCALGITKKLGLPFLYISSVGFPVEFSNNLRVPSCMSYCPMFSANDYTNQMTYVERAKNTLDSLFGTFIREWYIAPAINHLLSERLGPGLPSVLDIEKNASIIIVNDHFGLTYARPMLPNMVMAACLHCKPSQALPKELLDWVEGSGDDGFIYFSLGTVVNAEKMPKEFIDAFVEVFSKLKQRVIWKIKLDHIPNLSSNVKLFKWLPQQDLLGHPKIRMFITHGGLLSSQEAAYHGVPLLGFPTLVDQPFNLRTIENAGAGIYMKWKDFSKEALREAVNKILTDPKYKKNTAIRKKLTRDLQNPPLDTVAYWIEYVLRYNGAPQLRTGGLELTWYQYYQVDLLAFLLLLLLGVCYGLKILITKIFKTAFQSKKKTQKQD